MLCTVVKVASSDAKARLAFQLRHAPKPKAPVYSLGCDTRVCSRSCSPEVHANIQYRLYSVQSLPLSSSENSASSQLLPGSAATRASAQGKTQCNACCRCAGRERARGSSAGGESTRVGIFELLQQLAADLRAEDGWRHPASHASVRVQIALVALRRAEHLARRLPPDLPLVLRVRLVHRLTVLH
jgi:hypothetical protein